MAFGKRGQDYENQDQADDFLEETSRGKIAFSGNESGLASDSECPATGASTLTFTLPDDQVFFVGGKFSYTEEALRTMMRRGTEMRSIYRSRNLSGSITIEIEGKRCTCHYLPAETSGFRPALNGVAPKADEEQKIERNLIDDIRQACERFSSGNGASLSDQENENESNEPIYRLIRESSKSGCVLGSMIEKVATLMPMPPLDNVPLPLEQQAQERRPVTGKVTGHNGEDGHVLDDGRLIFYSGTIYPTGTMVRIEGGSVDSRSMTILKGDLRIEALQLALPLTD